ncbi:hypothetical protein, partial [Endozoicomonas sp. SESOKO3]|uniref:hypothetical protein n=1 Tax=Endozoicomonas sp. SESOKO3 TaxID=2828744 RepID=UPI0021493606
MPLPINKIPKNIHVTIVGPVAGWEFSFLIIWAKVNTDHTIHVWAPKRLIYQKILYSLLFSERNKITIEKDYPADLAQLRDSIWAKVDHFMGEDADIESLDIEKSDFSDNVKEAFTSQLTKINTALNQIETSISNAHVHRETSHFEKINSQYIRYSLGFSNTLTIERFIGLYHEYDLGGVYIDKGLMPKLKSKPFLKRSDSLNPISGMAASNEDRKELDRAKIRALLEKMFSDGMITDPAPYFDRYDTILPKEEFNRIKDIIENTSMGDLFHELEEYNLKRSNRHRLFLNKKVNFEDNIFPRSLDASIQPIMVTSRSRNSVLKMILDETRFLHETAENLRKSAISKQELISKTREKIENFYRESNVIVSSDNIDKVTTMLTALADDTKGTDDHIIDQLGYEAFERLININLKERPSIQLTDNFLANTPFYNRKSYDPDIDDLQIVPEQPYDKLIILNFSDNSNDKGQSLTKSSNLYKLYLTEKNSVLYDVVKTAPEGSKELKTIKGVPLNKIGRDTKVIITGTLYFPDISNERSSSYSREIVAELTSHLSTAIPQNTVVQSIVFFFDNSAQDIPGFEGTLDASQKDYVIPEVLRELAKEGVFANSAVAVRGSLSASVPQQTAVDPDRPSTSADAPHSELNRIVFTLNEESIVAYQARFGLASLDPRIKFTGTRIEVEHTNTRPEVKNTDTGAKKFLIKVILEHESIEARLKEDLIGVIVRNKPIDASIKENLVATILQHESIDSGLKEILVKAILELEFNDDGLEANRVDSSTEGESASDLSEDEVRKSTNDYDPQDPRKDARHYSLHDDFQSAILHGLVAQPATEKVAFVNPDKKETDRLEDTLRTALLSSSYREWLARYERRFTESNEVNLLEREMNTFQSEEAKNRAFENLKRRIKATSYDIFPLDLTKIKDVAALNAIYKNDFNNISVFTNLPSGSCSRRRRSADTGGCEARLRELASALRLLSDANTQLYIRDRTTDIALLDTANDSTLSRLQIFYTDLRRKEGKADLARTRGKHYVIALDNASFTRAQQQIKAGTLSGQPLLLKATPSYGYVLLTPEGRVQSAIAGGDGNQVTVIGQPARLITRALTTLVKDFTADSHISSLTVSDLPGSNHSSGINVLNALKTFIARAPANGKPLVGKLVIEPQSHSNSVFKRLVRDTKRLMPKDRPAIGALVLRSPATGRPEYWLFPGETKVLIPPRPTGSKALRNLPSSRLSVPAEPQTDTVNSLSAVARERSEFRQRLLDFDTTLKGLKTRHSLPDNILPMLDTLRRDGQGWRMDFMEPDTLARKNIHFTSAAFKRFQGFLQNAGRPSPSQVKGKKTATGGLERLRSFIGLHDLIAGIAPVGHHYKNTPTQNMTDTERQIHIGRQTLFYAAVTLEGADLTSLGVKGLKLFTPTFKQPFSSSQTAPKLPGTHSGKLSGGLKRAKVLGKKAGHFLPVLGLGVSAGSLTLTVMEYEKEKDPEVKKLMESRVIFESVDTAVSILSDLAGPAGFIIDGIMHFVRGIFNRHYQRKLNKLIYKKLRDASGKAVHIFNPIHAQLDPTSFLAKNQTLNALMSGDGKNLLTLNIKSIDLVNRTLTFGGGFSFSQTFIAGKKNDWAKCKDTTYVKNGPVHECASDINRLEYSKVPFNLIEDALKTLCRTESRLIGYQCRNGVFHNLDQMADKKMILMPSVPEWQVKLLYDQFDQTSRGSAPDSRSPGAKFLDAVGNDKLQRLYQKKVKNIRLTQYRGEHFSSKRTIVHTDKYIGQMFTRAGDFKYLSSRSRLDLDKRNYIIVFSKISAEFTRLLSYDLYSPEGAGNTYLLMSNGGHFIRIHPRGKTASTWVLNYNGPLPYSCLAGGGWKQRCSSRLDQNKKTWTLTLGETRFQFPAPTPDAPYRVIVQNANARFEWLPPDREVDREVDRKVIHRLYDNSELNNSGPRAQKLLRMTAHNTAASRFLPLELKQCNTSFLARCMDGAPVQWIRPHGRVVIGFRDVTPGSVSKLNPQWLEYQKYCQKKAEEYLETPYSCFPNKLGLAKTDWDKLDRVKLWYDTRHHKEIQLIVPNDRLQPVQGNPTIGYYFFDSVNSQVLFRNASALNQGIRHFREFDASEQGAVFGRKVSRTVPGKDDSQLLVFEAPYYYLLTATRSGQLAHRVIAAEALDSQLSATPIAATDKGLIPFQVVDSYDSRRILRAGFYDGSTQTYIAFLSSLLDGGRLIYGDDGSSLLQISEPVQKQLHKNHLPVHKVVGQQIYYLLFSQHSGNLYYLSTDVNRPAGIQRLSSGLQVIRPAGEQRTVAEMAKH